MNRRELIQGAAAVAVAVTVPALPTIAPTAPAGPPLLSFIVGSEGESDWEWFRALSKDDAIAAFMGENCGASECEVNPGEPPEDCDCEWCAMRCQLDADRVKRWDDRTYDNKPTPADWLRAGYSYRCACGGWGDHGVTLGEGGFICPDGVNVECEDCHDKRKRDDEHHAECRKLEQCEPFDTIVAALEAAQTRGHANASRLAQAVSGSF